MAVADVNNDGKPDIVTANNANGTVGVLLGRASGGFAPVSAYSVGAGGRPGDVQVADMNGDGRMDLIVQLDFSATVGVLLGQAGGGFAPISTYSTGANSSPLAVAVADMNGDGKPDIVTANYGTNPSNGFVGVLLGQVGGGFAPASAVPTGLYKRPLAVAVADLNSDGRLDVITTNENSIAGVLLGQAGGGLAPASFYSTGTASSPQAVAAADVNGDGRLDIVTANLGVPSYYTNAAAGVLLGQANGFAPVTTFPTGATSSPTDVAVADVNGDGRPDLVTANYGSDAAGVLLNTGTYTPLATATSTAAAEVILFPNPAHGGFTVQLPAAWGAGPVQATLLNALGQAVRQQTAVLPAGVPLAFATEGLAPGVYGLRLQAGGHTLTKRVVLE